MKNQICKLLFGTLILTGTNQASILKHHSHPLYLAETFENDDEKCFYANKKGRDRYAIV